MLQLQSNVPPPRRRPVNDRRKKYPFESMQVGHFFFVKGKTKNSIRSYFSTAGKQHGIQLTSKLIHARKVDGEWKECEENDEGATVGVGVWRIA
jgi:hypothetical protein